MVLPRAPFPYASASMYESRLKQHFEGMVEKD